MTYNLSLQSTSENGGLVGGHKPFVFLFCKMSLKFPFIVLKTNHVVVHSASRLDLFSVWQQGKRIYCKLSHTYCKLYCWQDLIELIMNLVTVLNDCQKTEVRQKETKKKPKKQQTKRKQHWHAQHCLAWSLWQSVCVCMRGRKRETMCHQW